MIFVCGGVLARWRVDSVPLGERCDCGMTAGARRRRAASCCLGGIAASGLQRRARRIGPRTGSQRSWSDYWECCAAVDVAKEFLRRCVTRYYCESQSKSFWPKTRRKFDPRNAHQRPVKVAKEHHCINGRDKMGSHFIFMKIAPRSRERPPALTSL